MTDGNMATTLAPSTDDPQTAKGFFDRIVSQLVERTELAAKVAQQATSIGALQDRLAETIRDRDTVRGELYTAKANAESLQAKLNIAADEISALKRLADEQKAAIGKLEHDLLDAWNARDVALQDRKDTQIALASAQKDNEWLQHQNRTRDDRIARLSADNTALSDAVKVAQDERDAFKTAFETIKATLDGLTKAISPMPEPNWSTAHDMNVSGEGGPGGAAGTFQGGGAGGSGYMEEPKVGPVPSETGQSPEASPVPSPSDQERPTPEPLSPEGAKVETAGERLSDDGFPKLGVHF